jgi:hypothetical protein
MKENNPVSLAFACLNILDDENYRRLLANLPKNKETENPQTLAMLNKLEENMMIEFINGTRPVITKLGKEAILTHNKKRKFEKLCGPI